MIVTRYFAVLMPFFVILATACNTPNTKSSDGNTAGDSVITSAVDSSKQTKILDKDSINLTLTSGSAQQEATMEKGRHIVFSFETKQLGKLSASVKANEPNGNVRIAQIFMPDNSADGPFGQDMEYNLKEPGIYRIVVSENQMAGNPYNGPFTIKINVSPR